MKNKQLQTKQQPTVKLSLDELSNISAGALSGIGRPEDLKVKEIPEWRI